MRLSKLRLVVFDIRVDFFKISVDFLKIKIKANFYAVRLFIVSVGAFLDLGVTIFDRGGF